MIRKWLNMKKDNIYNIICLILIACTIGINIYVGIVILSILMILMYLIYITNISDNTRLSLVKLYIFISIYLYVIRPFTFKNIPIIGDILLVVLLILGIIKYKKKAIPNGLNFFIVLCILVSILQVFNPNIIDKYSAIMEFRKTTFQFISIYIGYILIYDKKELNNILKFTLIISIPIMIYAIKQNVNFSNLDMMYLSLSSANKYTNMYAGEYRSIGVFSGPFHMGMFSLIMLCISLKFINIYKGNKKVMYYLIASISTIAVLATRTRTNIVALIFILFIHLINLIRKINIKTILYLLSICIVLLIVSTLDSINIQGESSIFSTIINITNDTRFMGRIETWIKSIEMICNNIIIGNGIGSAADAMYGVAINRVNPHNMFLKIFVELGIVGFIAFIGIWVLSFKQLKYIENNYKIFYLQIFSIILINGITGTSITAHPINSLFWMILGSSYTLGKIEKDL